MIITPKTAVELVLTKKTKNSRFRPYENNYQRFFFWAAFGSLIVGLISGGLAYFVNHHLVIYTALGALALSVALTFSYQIATVIPEFAKLKNIEREASSQLLQDFNADIELINELAETYELHHLTFAKESFLRMARQLRERISILVGAIEKLGLIPILITGYLSYTKAQKEGLTFGGVEMILAAFLVLYLLAVRMSTTAQWMEKIGCIYDQSIALKLKCSTSN